MMALLPLLLVGCDLSFKHADREFAEPLDSSREFPTVIHEPTAYGVLTRAIAPEGSDREVPAGTACTVCHGPTPEETWDLPKGEAFHTDVETTHGELSCDQCHSPRDRTQLHLADATLVPLLKVYDLCAQCHGSQARDFRNGAHGGMTGYWDLSQGSRVRNNCVDCHAPHAPAFEKFTPVLPPRDRYLGSH